MKLRKAGTVSVIVPAYNSEKYIQECIESILIQTYTDIQIIVVDDGSDDGTYDIVSAMSASDSRIELYRKENGGVSTARNFGIEKAKGRFIAFVDSDDVVGKHYIMGLLRAMGGNHVKLSVCGYKILHKGRNRKRYQTKYIPEYSGKFLKKEFIMKKMSFMIDDRVMITPWAKLYETELIQKGGIRFDIERTIGEDLLFNLQYLEKMERDSYISVISQTGYGYWIRGNDSLTHNFGRERIQNSEELYKHCLTFCALEGSYELQEKFTKLYFKGLLNYIETNVMKETSLKNKCRDIKEILSLKMMKTALPAVDNKKDYELELYRNSFKTKNCMVLLVLSCCRMFIKKNLRGY